MSTRVYKLYFDLTNTATRQNSLSLTLSKGIKEAHEGFPNTRDTRKITTEVLETIINHIEQQPVRFSYEIAQNIEAAPKGSLRYILLAGIANTLGRKYYVGKGNHDIKVGDNAEACLWVFQDILVALKAGEKLTGEEGHDDRRPSSESAEDEDEDEDEDDDDDDEDDEA